MIKQHIVQGLVVVDRRDHCQSADWGFDESVRCPLMEVAALPVDIGDIAGSLDAVAQRRPDVLMLNATLPARFMVKMARAVRNGMPTLPLIILPNVRLAVDELEESFLPDGADDTATRDTIARAMRSVHDRVSLQQRLLQLAQRDDLTGLHNRRGFMALAAQHLRYARKERQHLLLFFADLDDLKQINDRYGHSEGDKAIARAAAGIKRTFRDTDIAARVSGDEFVALMAAKPDRDIDTIAQRLQMNVKRFAAAETRYSLSLPVGVANFDPDAPHSLASLLRLAVADLYRKTREKKPAVLADVTAAGGKTRVNTGVALHKLAALEMAANRG